MCVLTPHATAADKKSGDKRESFFSNVPPPATLIFTRAALFIAQEKHEYQQKQRFFLFWSAASVSAADFFQSECVCNRLRTAEAPVADPSFFSKSECENHFLRQRELMKKMEKSARILRFVERLIGFFTRPQEALCSE